MAYMTGKQKAAVLLSLLGQETASAVLQQLPEEMATYMTSGFSVPPTQEQIAMVLHELRSLPPVVEPKPPSPREESLTSVPSEKELNTLAGLAKYMPVKLMEFLKNERRQMIVFLLSQLEDPERCQWGEKLLSSSKPVRLSVNLAISKKIQPSLEAFIVEKLR